MRALVIVVVATLAFGGQGIAVVPVAAAQERLLRVPQDYATISAAVAVAKDGDEIAVSAGTYVENVTIDGKYVKLSGLGAPSDVVLSPSPDVLPRSPLFIQNVPALPGRRVEVSGLTITGGNAPQGQGGGVTIAPNSSPLLHDNIIAGNYAEGYGGGISVHSGSSPVIRDNEITDNFSTHGGAGIFVVNQSSPVIVGNLISGNVTSGASISSGGSSGGGIYLENVPGAANLKSSPVIFGNDIINNDAEFAGGGVMVRTGADAIIESNYIAGNAAAYGGGVHLETTGSSVRMASNDIVSNVAIADAAFSGSGYGGGLSVYDGSRVVVDQNYFSDNEATHGGAGIVVAEGADVSISRTEFWSNAVTDVNGSGGALYAAHAAVRLENALMSGNAAGVGGAVSALDGADIDMVASTLIDNLEPRSFGGAVFAATTADAVSIQGSIFAGNENYQLFEEDAGTSMLHSNVYWQGSAGSGIYYSYDTHALNSAADLDQRDGIDGSTVADPQLSAELRPSVGSPAIGAVPAGVAPALDLDGKVRNDGQADAGALASSWSAEAALVYRFWSDRYRSHFYTASSDERELLLRDYDPSEWRYEFAAFTALAPGDPAGSAVHRFWSGTFRGHFYTASEAERVATENNFPDDIWSYEGVAYAAYPLSAQGATRVVYRFWSDEFRHHFYTSSAAERDFVIANYPESVWRYEGEQFKVPAG